MDLLACWFCRFAPAGPAHLAERLRCASCRAEGNAVYGGCAPGTPRRFRSQPLRPSDSRASPARTRVTFCTHKKSPKKRRETRTPLFVQSDACKGDTRLPLNHLFAAGLLVIGAVIVLLRLPALGMAGTSCRAIRIDGSTPLTGRTPLGTGQPKLDKIPGRDQIPEGFSHSVAEYHLSLIKSD